MMSSRLSSKLFPLIYETQILTVKGLKDMNPCNSLDISPSQDFCPREDKTKPESEGNPRCMEDDVTWKQDRS